ncbi:hypothetical protein E2C01_074697 [Portunus trituberculatus]|uniref:Uncharacterized protein n=1 Tax=Portunus trituberculatus TaxID=210409 RepID=A0A5B7IE62_PORTR|nr:hypothetical protein [Portunus trituberculatus]
MLRHNIKNGFQYDKNQKTLPDAMESSMKLFFRLDVELDTQILKDEEEDEDDDEEEEEMLLRVRGTQRQGVWVSHETNVASDYFQ